MCASQWAGVLSRLALEQERILNPVLDRVRTADHHQLRSLTGLIRNLSRHARNKDEMCEYGEEPGARPSPSSSSLRPPVTSSPIPAPSCPLHPCSHACGGRSIPRTKRPPHPVLRLQPPHPIGFVLVPHL